MEVYPYHGIAFFSPCWYYVGTSPIRIKSAARVLAQRPAGNLPEMLKKSFDKLRVKCQTNPTREILYAKHLPTREINHFI
ncbi:hypothetical protein A2704_05295 [Candidatus Kaiserbacteria bacterium RIFCSPHIGHO2_01_FULL_54_36b]|uniref:Uncharacterized protein n=1 Tax=Candidatus Kaiserbacteria bacterium RIFCSPHIGHO2_01_FULL_54_36b TaxID=1798483 RepID=A0A1F6CN80_9BACT|nr:MAG: hypothetical protein A2704_05295 [Candidatus Kaiserbacteria bacterium RIFCSPHIGHO2_01_FULL_54_36b]